MAGWIKLHRQLLKSDTFKNDKLLKVWIYCLLKTSNAEHEILVGRQKVKLLPGQFIYGRKRAAMDLDMPESTLRDYVEILVKSENITVRATNKYSVITLINWDTYQSNEEKDDSRHDSKRTAKGQQMDTNKNVKNVKNVKELKDITSQKFSDDSTPLILSKYLYQKILANDQKAKPPKFQNWADHMDKLIRIDKRAENEIRLVIDFCQKDEFWKSNILSTKKLRDKFSALVIKSGKAVSENGRDFSPKYNEPIDEVF